MLSPPLCPPPPPLTHSLGHALLLHPSLPLFPPPPLVALHFMSHNGARAANKVACKTDGQQFANLLHPHIVSKTQSTEYWIVLLSHLANSTRYQLDILPPPPRV